jgi:hypothetical protein
MATLPTVRRLVVEDFQQEKKWIGKLFDPVNNFMESVLSAFNRNLTLKENLAADIVSVTLSSVPTATTPAPVAWALRRAPVAIFVGQVARADGAAFTLSAAVGVQWEFGTKGLQITNLVGLTPTNSAQYTLALVAFTG